MTLSYHWHVRVARICNKYKWYHYVLGWHWQRLVSDEEMKDGVRFLEKLIKKKHIR